MIVETYVELTSNTDIGYSAYGFVTLIHKGVPYKCSLAEFNNGKLTIIVGHGHTELIPLNKCDFDLAILVEIHQTEKIGAVSWPQKI